MKDKLIKEDGTYVYRSFYGNSRQDGSKPVFTIIGTVMPRINSSALSVIDTFASDGGKVIEVKRSDVIDMVYNQGKMLPVLDSLISSSAVKEVKKVDTKKATRK